MFDVVIVGAGVIGCAIGYFLVRSSRGKMKLAVIEKKAVGGEANARAAGMLAAQVECESQGPLLYLAVESRKIFDQLDQELKEFSGVDIGYKKSGIVSLAFDLEHEEELRNRVQWQNEAGLECEWLLPERIAAKFPFVSRISVGGFWSPHDGQVSSNRLTAAFREGARKLGVTFFENENLDLLGLGESRLGFVETRTSRFYADQFVFTAGSWAGKILKDCVPIKPVKGQLLIFEMPRKYQETCGWETPIFFGKTPGPESISCYFTPKMDGHLFLGATVEDHGFDQTEIEVATKKMFATACEVLPELSSFSFKGTWVSPARFISSSRKNFFKV